MKKNLFKKSLSILIITLFLIINMIPIMANETIIEDKNDEIIIEYATVDLQGSTNIKQISLSENELIDIQNKLSNLFEELQLQKNNEDTLNLLKSYLNDDRYPILSRIFSNLFNFDFIGRRKLVVSQGMGPNLNLFKDRETAIVKPFTSWIYSGSNNVLPIPSATGVLSINPFRIQTYMGTQFGFMLRFRGIYINIGQPSSMQSYTFFIGSAKRIVGFELTPLS
jgi:hypothetical protein